MEKHYGQIVENAVRRSGYSLSDLAKELNVNRKTIYNWFTQKKLKSHIIYNVGIAIRHDFSKQFPELFTSDEFRMIPNNQQLYSTFAQQSQDEEEEKWKDQYITLLEIYNDALINNLNF